jgi:DNA polymerase IV
MPSTVAIRKCAEPVFVPPRFDVYRESVQTESRGLQGLHPVGRAALSLDELDVTDNLKGIPTAWETAKQIRARIYEETRLTASAGISCNKFLAKLASDYRKPNGQFAIMPRPSGSLCCDRTGGEVQRHGSVRAICGRRLALGR